MGIFLAYLLAGAFVAIGLYVLDQNVADSVWANAGLAWLKVVAWFGLAAGLLYTVFRYVKRKW